MASCPHVEVFTRFAKSHLSGSETDDYLIQLKLDHSLRVQANAITITQNEHHSAHTARLCELSALYHDIGRFPQYAKYRTFKDSNSKNHARLGVLTLRELKLPDDISASDWRIIRFAVAQHNVLHIKKTLPDHLNTPTKVVRDADKLDIFKVMIEHFEKDSPNNPVVTGGVKDVPDKYSDTVYDAVFSGKVGRYDDMRYANDFKLILISWLYDLHYSSSIQLLAQRKHLEHAFSLLPKDNKIQRLKEKTYNFMHYNNYPTP